MPERLISSLKPVFERELIFRVAKVLSSTKREALDKTSWHRAVFGALADAVVITDANDCCIDANPAACELLGFSRDELLHLDATTLSFHSGGWLETRRLAPGTAGVWRGVVHMRPKNGVAIAVEAHMSHTLFDGEPIYVSIQRKAP